MPAISTVITTDFQRKLSEDEVSLLYPLHLPGNNFKILSLPFYQKSCQIKKSLSIVK